MRISQCIGIAVVTAAFAAGSSIGSAADPPQQRAAPPPDLLEFLGSVDPPTDARQPDDGAWRGYLAQINTGKAARASPAPVQPKPAGSAAGSQKPNGGPSGGPSGG